MSHDATKGIASRIHAALKKASLSYHEVARRMDTTPTTVWNWANGNTTINIEKITKLALIAKVDPAYLAFGTMDEERADASDKKAGAVYVKEFKFTETIKPILRQEWQLSTRLFDRTLAIDAKRTFIYENTSDDVFGLAVGDYVIVDSDADDPEDYGAGYYLIFAPFFPQILHITPEYKDGVVLRVAKDKDKYIQSSENVVLGKIIGTIQRAALPNPNLIP